MGEREKRDKAVFYIKLTELFEEWYQSKIAGVSQNTVALTNLCKGEQANPATQLADKSRNDSIYCIFHPCKSHATLAQGIPTQ